MSPPDSPPASTGLFGRVQRHPFLSALLGFILVLAVLSLIASCAHRPENQPATATTYNPGNGYRFRNTPALPNNSDEVFVILAFSGGGTRAAAFSYGAMEKLAATKIRVHGQERRLLDEVDIISSISGGSFTAAYYGLYREKLFTGFPERFLYQNFTSALVRGLLNPLNWPSLATAKYDRIDMAADLYDRRLFDHKTFADLAKVNARPFIELNATDMSYVSRFEFTQDQFDLLGSDLSSYPVARGVAASSAFPGLLCPLTLRTYPNGKVPDWMDDALDNRRTGPRAYSTALVNKSYTDHANRPYVHLLDGGLADNVGLRGPAYAIASTQTLWSLKFLLNTEKIKYLVVIAVNAKPCGPSETDREEAAPGLFKVLSTVTDGPMSNYSDETIQMVRDYLERWRQDIVNSQTAARLSGTPIPVLPDIKFYSAELTFQDIRDEKERAYLNALPTRFDLPREGIDHLRAAAALLIDEAPDIQKLKEDLSHDEAAP